MIIIPDVHGRTFWKEAVAEMNDEEVIFLGDYLDPYEREGISPRLAIENLKEIIELKKAHPEQVTLLLGNHDFMTYISADMGSCRTDFVNVTEIKQIYRENRDLFTISAMRTIGDQKYLFTHAGILVNWAADRRVQSVIECQCDDAEAIANALNMLWAEHDPRLFSILNHVSKWRGGMQATGSPVWADLFEWDDECPEYEDVYQIFGHTQQMNAAVIREDYACLDCRKAFRLDEKGLRTVN